MRTVRLLGLFAALLAFWLALSGRVDPLFLGMGVASAALTTWMGVRLIDAVIGSGEGRPRINVWRLVTYLLWLLTRSQETR
jgi:multisubunit Na+/H+ antiporter MnhE subunit